MGEWIQIHAFLISVLDGGEWLASHPGLYTPSPPPLGRNMQYPLDRWLSEPQSQCGNGSEENNLCPYWESKPSCPAHGLVTILT